MAKAAAQKAPAIDTALLAKLTGGLSDRKTIAKIGSDIGHLYSEFLPDIFHSETGIAIDVEYVGSESGLMTDLIANVGQNVAVADCSLRNWCPNFMMTVGNGFVIALMERMLGAAPDSIGERAQPVPYRARPRGHGSRPHRRRPAFRRQRAGRF